MVIAVLVATSRTAMNARKDDPGKPRILHDLWEEMVCLEKATDKRRDTATRKPARAPAERAPRDAKQTEPIRKQSGPIVVKRRARKGEDGEAKGRSGIRPRSYARS